LGNLSERLGADLIEVRQGIGLDELIGFQFLHPGVGYGGSCFAKDVSAMTALSEQVGRPSLILDAVQRVNEAQKGLLMAKLAELLDGNLAGKTVAVWGLAFKPRTDDVREAPSLVLIRQLLDAGAKVRVFDPEALDNVKQIFGDAITYCDRAYGTAEGADALAVVTEWQEFRNPDFEILGRLMNRRVIVDGRNLYDPAQMLELGFAYASVGRQTVRPDSQSDPAATLAPEISTPTTS
jgi:UDPglucose 6-dehydrogenase